MAINNIWVFAQDADGAPTSGTLELLTKARTSAVRSRRSSAATPRRSPATLGDVRRDQGLRHRRPRRQAARPGRRRRR